MSPRLARRVRDALDILARSDDGVFAVDGRQRVVYWSGAAQRLLGLPAAGVLGRYCYDVILGRDYEGNPFCRRDCPTMRAARRGQPTPNYDVACGRNGAELWLNVSVIPLPRASPDAPALVHLVRDVSARRRSERLAQAAIKSVEDFVAGGRASVACGGPYPVPGPSLTARELEVLQLLGDGLGTQQLATGLGVSRATVRNHVQRLLAKMGAHTRLEAVVRGRRLRLIESDENAAPTPFEEART